MDAKQMDKNHKTNTRTNSSVNVKLVIFITQDQKVTYHERVEKIDFESDNTETKTPQ